MDDREIVEAIVDGDLSGLAAAYDEYAESLYGYCRRMLAEREVVELDLRHDLQGADLAAVLGVPRTQAHVLASHARGELEAALGPLFVARTGRRGCAELDLLLDGWDGQLTGSTRKLVSGHIAQCDACSDRSHGALRGAVRHGMAPLAALPPQLRDEVLELCIDSSPETLAYRRGVRPRAG